MRQESIFGDLILRGGWTKSNPRNSPSGKEPLMLLSMAHWAHSISSQVHWMFPQEERGEKCNVCGEMFLSLGDEPACQKCCKKGKKGKRVSIPTPKSTLTPKSFSLASTPKSIPESIIESPESTPEPAPKPASTSTSRANLQIHFTDSSPQPRKQSMIFYSLSSSFLN